jgi:hypothetical protein
MTAEALVSQLKGVVGKAPRWRALCPAHVSTHGTRSLSILETADGRLLFHCHAGCDVEQVCSAIGIKLEDLFPDALRSDQDRPPKIIKPWTPREVCQAMEVPLTLAWMLLTKVGGGTRLTKAERIECVRVSEVCASLIHEIAGGN